MHILSTVFAGIAWDPHIRGVLVVMVGVSVLIGSVYLLLGTNLGSRLGLLVAFAGLTGWLSILTFVWLLTPPGNGPRGANPSWKPVEIYVNGPNATPKTAAADVLPQPQDFPTADQILADNPDLSAEYPNGFTLSDLEGSHSALLQPYLDQVSLHGWRLIPTSAAGEAQTAADEELVAAGFFKDSTEYKKLNTFEYGGKPTLAEYCPDADRGGNLPGDPICRIQYKFYKLIHFRHPTHYSIVQVQQVLPQEARPGEAPPIPVVDPNAPVVSVVLVRDLGFVRLIPAIYFTIAFSLFIFFVLVLHYRDKTLMKNREAVKAG